MLVNGVLYLSITDHIWAVDTTGDSLYTACIVALNPDTGKMKWAFQATPHDTHDHDAGQTPILFDGEFGGKQRKLLAQVSRNG